jgi:transcriptional regulator with XRE-family HTH domain
MNQTPIQIARLSKKLSQEKTARLLDISLRHYQKIEYGEVLPNIRTGLRLALILEVNPYELFNIEYS